MDIFRGYAIDVRCRYFLDFRRILVEPVGGISIELVGHALGENFIGRVEAEDECVEDRVFGLLDFIVGDGILGQIVDVFIERLDGLDCALAFGSRDKLQDAGMAEVGANAAAYVVG